jgi:hypothetical protein
MVLILCGRVMMVNYINGLKTPLGLLAILVMTLMLVLLGARRTLTELTELTELMDIHSDILPSKKT